MRVAATIFFILISFSAAYADQMTCQSFISRLVQAAHNSGDDVTAPNEDHLVLQPDGTDPGHYEVAGVAGVKGDLTCVENDAFESFNIHSEQEGIDDKEAVSRILRVLGLSTAATCVTDPAPGKACNDRIKALFLNAYDDFDEARRRGDPRPGSSRTLDVSPESRAQLNLTPDGAFFSLRARQP